MLADVRSASSHVRVPLLWGYPHHTGVIRYGSTFHPVSRVRAFHLINREDEPMKLETNVAIMVIVIATCLFGRVDTAAALEFPVKNLRVGEVRQYDSSYPYIRSVGFEIVFDIPDPYGLREDDTVDSTNNGLNMPLDTFQHWVNFIPNSNNYDSTYSHRQVTIRGSDYAEVRRWYSYGYHLEGSPNYPEYCNTYVSCNPVVTVRVTTVPLYYFNKGGELRSQNQVTQTINIDVSNLNDSVPTDPTPPEELNTHTLPYVLSASNGAQTGFVRIVNQSDQAGTVRITAIDDTGERFGPINLSLDANEAVNFNSHDLEQGNASKGLSGGAGDGGGSWRLVLETALNITPLAYIRTADGFVTSMHDVAPVSGMDHSVLFFNPGSNTRQISRLRIFNPGTTTAEVTITGRDDAGGDAPGGAVRLILSARSARTLTAQSLEAGGDGFDGRLGNGAGKWRLSVTSNVAIQVMSLLASPTGHISNLSTVPID